jgi:hypothetical protein
MDRVTQTWRRFLNVVHPRRALAPTRAKPATAQRTSPTIALDPRMIPSPWPVKTIPVAARTAAMIQRLRSGASSMAS